MKVAVVFWSGTGNTEAMANAVAEGARTAGADVSLLTSDAFNANLVSDYDALIFGCPAMGAEVLEETEFDPMFTDVEGHLVGKKVALFGSYGWGDGEWMRNWEETCESNGASMAADFVICCGTPDGDVLEECESLGAALV